PSHSLEPLKGGWTDYPHESSIPRISLKRPLSKCTIHHPKSLSSLKKSVTSSGKEMKHCTKPEKAIKTMADHSQKWHDGSSSRNIDSSSNTEGTNAIVSKLDSLGRDMKKLNENVHAIQVGWQLCGGAHLDKECPLNEEVESVEEVKYGEFGRSSPFSNGAKYHVGPPRYYTHIDNRSPFR
ncbi:hypothetical protein Tco_0957989, partial [Tanacetum coccineum]